MSPRSPKCSSVLRLLVPDITLTEAFLLESAGRFVTVAFKFVPYRLGIDEAGSGAVASVLGLPPVTGVTLALVRRIRIIVLNAIGLLLLIRQNVNVGTDVNHGGHGEHEAIFINGPQSPATQFLRFADAFTP